MERASPAAAAPPIRSRRNRRAPGGHQQRDGGADDPRLRGGGEAQRVRLQQVVEAGLARHQQERAASSPPGASSFARSRGRKRTAKGAMSARPIVMRIHITDQGLSACRTTRMAAKELPQSSMAPSTAATGSRAARDGGARRRVGGDGARGGRGGRFHAGLTSGAECSMEAAGGWRPGPVCPEIQGCFATAQDPRDQDLPRGVAGQALPEGVRRPLQRVAAAGHHPQRVALEQLGQEAPLRPSGVTRKVHRRGPGPSWVARARKKGAIRPWVSSSRYSPPGRSRRRAEG